MTRRRKHNRRRRRFLLLLALLLLRLWMDNRGVILREYPVSADLPPAFDGYRIAVVSDLHGKEMLYDRILRRLSACAPDMIAITGDVSDEESQWEALEPFLRSMSEIAPCYYVSGNHEWADLSPEPFFRKLGDCGITLLRNQAVTLTENGAQLLLVGVEDANGYADMETPAELMQRIRQESAAYTVVLCHRPGLFPQLAALGGDLIISGHNHGGLVRLPFVGGLFSPGGWLPEYDRGLFTLGNSQMLVSPGLAGWNNIPRLFNRPEISVVELRVRSEK